MKIKMLVLLSTLVLSLPAFAANPLQGLSQDIISVHLGLTSGLCNDEASEEPKAYDVGQHNILYIVPCLSTTSDSQYKVYIKRNTGSIEPVAFLKWNKNDSSLRTGLDAANVEFSVSKSLLITTSYEYSSTSCGQQSKVKFGVSQSGDLYIKTTQIRAKKRCNETWVKPNKWPIVFKQ